MSLGCLRLVLCHAVRAAHRPVRSTSPTSLLLQPTHRPCRPLTGYLGVDLQNWSQFCTAVGGSEETMESELQQQKNKKKLDPKARVAIGSVGRNIHQRHVQLLGVDGGLLGVMHKMDALRMMDEKGLKLVPVNEHSDPPVYRLMSGKQIHEEQMKLKEKQKAKAAGLVQVKELILSSDIMPHDLGTKLKQVETWLDKKYHIKLTLKTTRSYNSETALDTVLDQMVEKICVPVGFVSKTKLIHEGRAATCILRPPSAKELQVTQRGTQNPTKQPQEEPVTEKTSKPDPLKDSEQQQ